MDQLNCLEIPMIEVNSFTSSILFQSLTLLVEIFILVAVFTFAFLVEPKIMIVIISMFIIVLVLFLITKKIVKAQGKIREI